MKIILAGQNFHVRGGSDRMFLNQYDLFKAKGIEVAPFCAGSSKNIENPWSSFFVSKSANLERPSITDIPRYIYNREASKAICRLIDKFDPNLVHCHIYYGKLTSSILGAIKNRGVPIVQTLHEYKIVCPAYTLISGDGRICEKCSGFNFHHSVINRCNKSSISRSLISCLESYVSHANGAVYDFDHFVAVSEFLREKVIAMGVPRHKVTTIHNFTDAEFIVPNSKGGRYFIYFGRLEIVKGVWTLIKVFEKLKTIPLVVVGDGTELSALQSYCEERDVKNISFVGHKAQAELSSLIAGACATIAPSIWYETFGLTLTESFAHGKPVIASKIGGMSEVVEDGVDGLLVEPGNDQELLEAVVFLNKNPAAAAEMGRMGRRNVEEKFNKHIYYEKHMDLYKRLINR